MIEGARILRDRFNRDRLSKLDQQRRDVGPNGWTCHVCGDYRPDAKISVLSTTTDTKTGIAVQQNVRYCNDRSACKTGARDVDFLG